MHQAENEERLGLVPNTLLVWLVPEGRDEKCWSPLQPHDLVPEALYLTLGAVGLGVLCLPHVGKPTTCLCFIPGFYPPPGPHPPMGYYPPGPYPPGPYPPGPYPGPGGHTATVLVPSGTATTVTVLQGEIFEGAPVQTVCPHCQQAITTKISYEIGLMNFVLGFFCCFMG